MFKFVGWGLDGQKDEIHSFLTMYIMGGGWRWVKTMIFPKQLFWVSRFWIIKLQTGLGPKLLFSTCDLTNLEHKAMLRFFREIRKSATKIFGYEWPPPFPKIQSPFGTLKSAKKLFGSEMTPPPFGSFPKIHPSF